MAVALCAVITAMPGVVWFALFFAELVLQAECQERRKQWHGGLETGGPSQSRDPFCCSVRLTLLISWELESWASCRKAIGITDIPVTMRCPHATLSTGDFRL